MSKASPKLVCLGNFTVDDVYLPGGGFSPDCLGGDALYAALGARLWEPQVQLLAPLSPDIPGRALEAMRATGFDYTSLPIRAAPTIRNRIFYDDQGGRRWEILTSQEVFHILSPTPEDIPQDYLGATAFLVLAMTLEAQEVLLAWLRKNTNAILTLDTQEDYVSGNEARIFRLLPLVDIFMPSAAETVQMFGHRDWTHAAVEFSKMGPQVVVIKCGEEGVFVYDGRKDDWFQQPHLAETVVDVTGAGDAFCGGFMAAYLADPQDLKTAALAGSISASYAIASFGMQALLSATPQEAREKLRLFAGA